MTNSPGALARTEHRCSRRRRLHHRGAVRLRWRRDAQERGRAISCRAGGLLPLRHGAGLALRSDPEEAGAEARQNRRQRIASAVIDKSDDGKLFWRKVNDIAFQNLDAWVPDIFGSAAEYQPSTGAWRISSEALGRDLEEDLSISPRTASRTGASGTLAMPSEASAAPSTS